MKTDVSSSKSKLHSIVTEAPFDWTEALSVKTYLMYGFKWRGNTKTVAMCGSKVNRKHKDGYNVLV